MMPAMLRAGESTPDASIEAVRIALARACDIGCLVVLTYLAASRIFYEEFGVSLIFGADRLILLAAAIGLVVARLLATRVDPRLTTAAVALLSAVAAPLMLLPPLGVNVENPVRAALIPVKARLFHVLFRTSEPRGLYRLDDRYGFVHVPGAAASMRGRGFTASYTVDADGNRTMPVPAVARSTVVFLGDSVTFGAGVNDSETFAHVLATEHWTDIRVINAGVGGWGLTQIHLRLIDLLAQPLLPTAVLVAIIPDDLRRSHLRRPIVPGLLKRLEWIDGQWVSRTLTYTNPVVDEPMRLQQEASHATATFTAMSDLARSRDVGFGVILLDDDDDYPPEMVYELARRGAAVLDLSRLGQTWLPYDTHPDPEGHRTIARAIAASSLTELVYRRTTAPD
jgi:hypothetical protein